MLPTNNKRYNKHTVQEQTQMKLIMSRSLRNRLRKIRVILNVSRNALTLFFIVVFGGGLVFHLYYTDPLTGLHPGFWKGVYAAFSLVFFASILDFPQEWYLEILFFIVPILGLVAIIDGLLRFGTTLIDKNSRGQKWQVVMASIYNKHIIVCGAGRIGFRVILELVKYGEDVVAIEPNPEGQFIEKLSALDVPLITADARQHSVLMQAGVDKADAIIPCTDDDMTNMDIALDARETNPQIKVVMRMFDPDLARRIEKGFGIHTAFSTSALAAPMFAAAAMRVKTQHSFYVKGQLMNMSEVEVQPCSQLTGWSVEKLENQLDLTVVYFQNGEEVDLHPPNHLCLQEQTRLMVIASMETLKELDRLNCST